MKFNGLACSQENRETRSMIDIFIHKLTSEDLNEVKIPEMQVSTKLQSSNRAIFSLARLESTVALRVAWIVPFFLGSVAFI